MGGPLEAERHVLTITEATFKYNFESEEIFAGEVLSTDSFTTNGTYTYGEDASLRFVSADTTMIGVVYDSKIILDTDSPYPNRKLQFEKRD
ncbi:MAG: hypothetical protein LBJ39_02205 [Tannerellaceae bacterium]|nr:hypothetical protein [Tannerellaceae bacterium]